MRALLQRVERAEVRVGGSRIASIGPGVLVLLGIGQGDDEHVADELSRRTAKLRIFQDDAGRTNRSLLDVGGEALVVSQFTLYADTTRGRRPGFTDAAAPAHADALYRRFSEGLRSAGVRHVETGRFGAKMAVELVNDGPFTILLEGASGG